MRLLNILKMITPQIGHLLIDEYNFLGMVTEVESIDYNNTYIINIEWYIEGEAHSEIYRVGNKKHVEYELEFINVLYYKEMRERYLKFRSEN